MGMAMEAAKPQLTSTVVISIRYGEEAGTELDAYYNVVSWDTDGPWLILTHADHSTSLLQVEAGHGVTITPDTD